ncbi:cytochrome c oxidase cbb3-type subunit IV [Gammaproteobacteria bacterium]
MNFLLIHQIYTLFLFVLFIGILGWAWGEKRQTSFQEASQLPFADDSTETAFTASTDKENHHE